jgi:hypothetical protein
MDNDTEMHRDGSQYRYHIDTTWFNDQERSFTMLASSRLCQASKKKKPPKSESALLSTIKQCCSKRDDYIAPNMPLLEMVFRLFLANSNQPLTLEQIQERIEQRLSESAEPRDLSVSKLKRIIDNDRYYGLRPAAADEGQEAATAPENQ